MSGLYAVGLMMVVLLVIVVFAELGAIGLLVMGIRRRRHVWTALALPLSGGALLAHGLVASAVRRNDADLFYVLLAATLPAATCLTAAYVLVLGRRPRADD